MEHRGGRRARAVVTTVGLALGIVLATACSSTGEPAAEVVPSSGTTAAPTTTPATAAPTTTAAPVSLLDAACAGTLTVSTVGRAAAAVGSELSGIVASRAHPGVYWVHDDSGAGPEVYAIALDGTLLGTYELAAGAIDWEDIAIGPAAGGDGWSLYLADIGDNSEARPDVQLHVIDEPAVSADGGATGSPEAIQPVGAVRTITLTYPDHPHNAEAVLVDPTTGDLVIVTKENSGVAQVFVAPAAEIASATAVTPVLAGTVDMGAGLGGLVTGADISPDGSVVAIRTYATVRLYARQPGQSVADALVPPPCDGPMPIEVQGEAVAIAADGRSYVTVSEGDQALLHQTAPPTAP